MLRLHETLPYGMAPAPIPEQQRLCFLSPAFFLLQLLRLLQRLQRFQPADVPAEQIKCQYDLPLCNLTQDAGTKGFLNRGHDKMEKLLTKIENNDYEPNPSPLCHWCEFCQSNPNAPEQGKMMCPYFMHWTKDKKDFSKENEWHGLENHKAVLEAYHQKYAKKD